MASGAQGHEVVEGVGLPVVAVLARKEAKLAERAQMVDVVSAAFPLRRATLPAAMAVARARGGAGVRPARSVIVRRQQAPFPLQASSGFGGDPQPAAGGFVLPRRQVDGAVAERLV